MDVDVMCPKCGRVNFVFIPRAKWGEKRYKKCQWCKQGMSVQIKVAKIKNIESFLQKQHEQPVSSGPGYPTDSKVLKTGEGGVDCSSAPID